MKAAKYQYYHFLFLIAFLVIIIGFAAYFRWDMFMTSSAAKNRVPLDTEERVETFLDKVIETREV
jgi:hypothetical protein